MNTRNSDQLIHAFLQETRDELPERAYAAVRREIDKAPQRIVVGPWRTPFMDNVSRFAVPAFAVTLLVTLALAGMNVFGVKAPPLPGAPTSSPSVSTAQPTATPSVSVLSPAQVNTHLAAGTYGTTFPTRATFTMTVPDGWQLDDISSGNLTLARYSDMNTWIFVSGVLGVFRDPCHSPDDPTPVDQTVSAVTQELTHMTDIPASSPTAVEVGGKSGTAFTLDVQIDTSTSSCTHGDMLPEWRLPLGWNFNGVSGSQQKVWVLAVGADPLLVTVISFEAAPPIDAQSAEDIVNSMTFP